ncbi:Uncharacterised protein [Klebsiella pneumoniae]|nr:Uncharacterised protein [Klebsiella pneumoniae]
MDNILTWRQRDTIHRLLIGQQAELAQGFAVSFEETRVNPFVVAGFPAITGVPEDFADTHAFAQSVKQVKQQLRYLRLFNQIAYGISQHHIMLIIACGFHCRRDTSDGQLAGT